MKACKSTNSTESSSNRDTGHGTIHHGEYKNDVFTASQLIAHALPALSHTVTTRLYTETTKLRFTVRMAKHAAGDRRWRR